MLQLLLVLYKRPDLEWKTFQQTWSEIYGPQVAQIPGARNYEHSYLMPDPANPVSICDAVAQLSFDSPESLREGLASSQGQMALTALVHVLDHQKFKLMVREEQP
jgi:uncharacterized protein (TIGR02118 family)